MLIFWIVYLVGYILSYLVFRYNERNCWTIGLRTEALFFSFFSWLIVFISLILYILEAYKSKRPATW